MRHTLCLAATVLIAAAASAEELSRTLTFARPIEGITAIEVEAGVGEVEIIAASGPEISATVEVTMDSHSGWGSRRAEQRLEEIELVGEVRGNRLLLHLSHNSGSNHKWGEDWSILVPRGIARSLELGVGEVRVLDTDADTIIDVGVGDVEVEGNWAAFGTIAAECGVGEVSLHSPEGTDRGAGFISRELRTKGPGQAQLDVEAGVGDIVIRMR